MSEHKLGIIVPYRNRYQQLIHFKQANTSYLDDTGIDYVVIIVEQDDATAFNRGKLLNIGVQRAEELGCDYVVLHDIDMIPEDVDYSYADFPTHLATNFVSGRKTFGIHFDQYFGGVTLFPLRTFKKINGYSNDYWGWGFEDDDLFYRLLQSNYPVKVHKVPNYISSTASLMFNGVDSYVIANNILNYKSNFSIFISLKVGDVKLDHTKELDRYTVFCAPGYDFSIYYDSFKRYNFEIFDRRGNIHSIVSEIADKKNTKLTVIWEQDTKHLTVYIDSTVLGRRYIPEGLFNYSKYKDFYIGCSNRTEDAHHTINYFQGSIDTFAIFNSALTSEEIDSLVQNSALGLTSNFSRYKSPQNLITYYDPKFIRNYKLQDLSSKDNHGTLENCWVEPTNFTQYKDIPIPHRKQCTFKLLDYNPGGYLNGRWKDQLTRYNQLKFINEVAPGYKPTLNDGLNSLKFKLHGEINLDNIYHLNVGI
jgi:hypothetical protein